MKSRAFLLLLIGVLPATAQHLVPQPVFDAIAGEYSGDYAERMAKNELNADSAGARERLRAYQQVLEAMTAETETGAKVFDMEGWARVSKAGRVPHRLVLTPIDASVFGSLSGDEKKWWGEQEERFASDSPGGGLPLEPPFDLIAFEAINFMDGKRTAGEVAAWLSLEFNRDFDVVWMERLVGILEGVKVVKAE